MELINKKHEEITQNLRVTLNAYFKIENDRTVYFSAGNSKLFGLSKGLYIHFQNDEERWYFYCNTENDGFKLGGRHGKTSTFICDASLVKLIQKRALISIGTKFPVELTKCKINGHHLLEIMLQKPIEDIPKPIIKKMGRPKKVTQYYENIAFGYHIPKKAI